MKDKGKEKKVLFPKIQEIIDRRKKEKEEEVLGITQYVQTKKNQAEEEFKASFPYYKEFFFAHGILIKITLIKIMRAWYKPKQVIFNPWARLKPIKITAVLHRDSREDNERAFWTGSIGSKEEVSIRLYDLGETFKLIINDSHGNKKEVNLRELTTGFQEFLWSTLEYYKKDYSLTIELDKKIDFLDLLKKFITEMKAKRAIFGKTRKEEEAKDRIKDQRESKRLRTERVNSYKKIYKENRSIIRPKLDEIYLFIKNNTNYSLARPFAGFSYGLQEETIWILINDSQLYDRNDRVIGIFCLSLAKSFFFRKLETLIIAVLSVSYWEEKPRAYLHFRLRNNKINKKGAFDIEDLLDEYVKIEANPPKEELDKILDSWLERFIDNLKTEDLKNAPKESPLIESSKFRTEFLKNKKAK